MKHCHFSILYNELPFLKQKMSFLYENFDQLIFYDLNVTDPVGEYTFSTDGTHEFIRDYPDPENKITLIETKNLDHVSIEGMPGHGSHGKRKMFIEGSKYIKDDIDVYWCTDMDEFFTKGLISKVENIFSSTDYDHVDLYHLLYYKDLDHILADPDNALFDLALPRIARHAPGNIYGHCSLKDQYRKLCKIHPQEELYYHFAWVGEKRVKFKFDFYVSNGASAENYKNYSENIWDNFNPSQIKTETGKLYGYPQMHPNPAIKKGVLKCEIELPSYINKEQLLGDLNDTDI